MRDEKLLRELTQLWGVAGFEKEVRKFIEREAEPYGDEIYTDAMGNLIVCKKGTGGDRAKKIMYAAHMDEIGFMVKTIGLAGRTGIYHDGKDRACGVLGCREKFPALWHREQPQYLVCRHHGGRQRGGNPLCRQGRQGASDCV